MPLSGPAGPPKRSRGGLVALVAGVAVILIGAGAGAIALLNSTDPQPSPSAGPRSAWLDYFIPARVGRSCTFEGTLDMAPVTGTSTLTQRVTGVETTADGLRIDLNVVTRTELDTPGIDVPPETSQDISYLIANDGTVSAPGFATSMGGFDVETDGFVAFPSIEDLRSGESVLSSIQVAMAPTDPVMREDLGQLIRPGDTALELEIEAEVEGAEAETITTPAGEYTDVVGVAMSFTDIQFLNPAPGMESQAESIAQLISGFMPSTTTWFARDVGIVRTDVEGFGTTTSSALTGCTG
jgi:hypothetical protein